KVMSSSLVKLTMRGSPPPAGRQFVFLEFLDAGVTPAGPSKVPAPIILSPGPGERTELGNLPGDAILQGVRSFVAHLSPRRPGFTGSHRFPTALSCSVSKTPSPRYCIGRQRRLF